MVRQRVRIRFAKLGDLRWIGHRDLARQLERLFRRAGLRLAMSQGYHPKARMSFPSALALGMLGEDEVVEVELAEAQSGEEILARLTACAPPGLRFLQAELLGPQEPKAQLRSATYHIALPAERVEPTIHRAAELMARPSCLVRRAGRAKAIDVRRNLEMLRVEDGILQMRLAASRDAEAGPRDVLAALGLDDLEVSGIPITRTRLELHKPRRSAAGNPHGKTSNHACSPPLPVKKART